MDELRLYSACDLLTAKGDELGKGNFASVQICKIHKSEQFVAVKYFAHNNDQKTLSNAKNEARILTKSKHDNIIRIMGKVEWGNYYGIILELLLWGNLEDLLNAGEKIENELRPIPISMKLRCRFFFELANALQHLHCFSEGPYKHGDVKPENVLLNHILKIKLADFGSAEGPSITTSHKNTQHTPLYTAPEFFNERHKPKTTEMDVYSYGVSGHEILTRKKVFSGNAVALKLFQDQTKEKGLKLQTEFFDEAAKNCSTEEDLDLFSELKKVMQLCLVKEPTKRPHISNICEKVEGLARFYVIYNDQITEEAKDLALKFTRTVNEDVERIPLKEWIKLYPPNVEISSCDNSVSLNSVQPVFSDEQSSSETKFLSQVNANAQNNAQMEMIPLNEVHKPLIKRMRDMSQSGVVEEENVFSEAPGEKCNTEAELLPHPNAEAQNNDEEMMPPIQIHEPSIQRMSNVSESEVAAEGKALSEVPDKQNNAEEKLLPQLNEEAQNNVMHIFPLIRSHEPSIEKSSGALQSEVVEEEEALDPEADKNMERALLGQDPERVEEEEVLGLEADDILERASLDQEPDRQNDEEGENETDNHRTQCVFWTHHFETIRRNQLRTCLVVTSVIFFSVSFGLLGFLSKRVSQKFSPNFTNYTVDQGGMLQILCNANLYLSSPPLRWRKVNNSRSVEIPIVMERNLTSQLAEYQVLYSNDNKALLVLTDVQQTSNYICINYLAAVAEITVKARMLSQDAVVGSGNLTCLQGNSRSNLVVNSLCSSISDLDKRMSYMCYRLHYCHKTDNTYSHEIEASCVPADQCSSLMCSNNNFPGLTQDSCQATCCSTNKCNDNFVSNDDYSTCDELGDLLGFFMFVLMVLLGGLAVMIIAILLWIRFCLR